MRRWIIIDLVLLTLLIGTLFYIKHYFEVQADNYKREQEQSSQCPTWLQDLPQKGCEK